MRFNFDDYDKTYVMHCDTEEKAKVFLNHLHLIGKSWSSGRGYDSRFIWRGEDSCYRFVAGTFDRMEYYTSDKAAGDFGYIIKVLEFDDFDWEDQDQQQQEFDFSFDDLMSFG